LGETVGSKPVGTVVFKRGGGVGTTFFQHRNEIEKLATSSGEKMTLGRCPVSGAHQIKRSLGRKGLTPKHDEPGNHGKHCPRFGGRKKVNGRRGKKHQGKRQDGLVHVKKNCIKPTKRKKECCGKTCKGSCCQHPGRPKETRSGRFGIPLINMKNIRRNCLDQTKFQKNGWGRVGHKN